MSAPPLLEVEGLDVSFIGGRVPFQAVRDVSFTLGRERLGIVGESGSGKSTTGRALLGLLPHTAKVTAKRLSFAGGPRSWAFGESLAGAARPAHVHGHAGPEILAQPARQGGRADHARPFSCTATSLGPKPNGARSPCWRPCVFAIPNASSISIRISSQGGMGQRVMIAVMLIGEPDLLIADEPTSALDVTVQNQVLRILDDLVSARGMGLIFISHNLTVIASFCDRVLVMYRGRIVEELAACDLAKASHPYTRALIAAAPDLDHPRAELAVVPRDPAWAR